LKSRRRKEKGNKYCVEGNTITLVNPMV